MRKFLKWTVRVVLALLILLVLAWVFRAPLFGGLVRDAVRSALQDALGGRFEVGEIGGSWLADVELTELRQVEAGEGPIQALALQKVSARYSLWALLGDAPLAAIEAVSVHRLDLVLDTTKAPPEKEETEPFDPGSLLELVPVTLPDLTVAGHVRVVLPDDQEIATALDISGGGEALELALSQLALPEVEGVTVPSALAIKVSRPSRDRLAVALDRAVDWLTVKRAELVRAEKDSWALESELALWSGEVAARIGPEQGSVRLRDLALSELPQEWLAGLGDDVPLPARAVVAGDLETGALLSGDVAFRGSLVVDDLRLGALDGRLEVAGIRFEPEGVSQLEELALDLGSNRVRARSLGCDLRRIEPSLRVRQLVVDVPDTEPVVEALGFTQELAPYGDVSLAVRLEAAGAWSEGIQVSELALRLGESALELTGGLAAPPADASPLRLGLDLELAGQLGADLARQLPESLGVPAIDGVVNLSGRLTGDLVAPRAIVDVAAADLRVTEQQIDALKARLEYAGSRLDVGALSVRGQGLSVEGAGAIDLDAARLEGVRLEAEIADLESLRSFWSGMPDLKGGLTASVTAEGPLGADWRALEARVDARARDLVLDQRAFGRADARGTVSGGRVNVEAFGWQGPQGRVTATGLYDHDAARVRDLVVDLDVPELSALADLLPRELAPAGKLELRLRADLEAVHEMERLEGTGDLTVAGEALRLRGESLGDLVADAKLRGRRLDVSRLQLDGETARVEGTGSLALDDAEASRLTLEAAVPALTRLRSLVPALAGLEGRAAVTADLRKAPGRPFGEIEGTASLQAEDLVWSDDEYGRLECDLEGRGGSIALNRFEGEGPWGKATTTGRLGLGSETQRLELDALTLVRPKSEIVAKTPIVVERQGDVVTVRAFEIEAVEGSVKGAGRCDLAARSLQLSLEGDLPKLETLGVPVEGALRFELEGRGSFDDPEFGLRASSDEVTWRAFTGPLRLALAQRPSGAPDLDLSFDGGSACKIDAKGFLPWRLGAAGLLPVPDAGALEVRAVAEKPETLVDLSEIEGLTSSRFELDIVHRAGDVEARLSASDVALSAGSGALETVGKWTLEARAGASGLQASMVAPDGAPLTLALRAESPYRFDFRDPATWNIDPDTVSLQGKVTAEVPDLSSFRALARESIVFIRGKAHCDLDIGGRLSEPTVKGSAAADDFALRLRGDIPPIDRGTLAFRMSGRRVDIETLEARVGYGPVRAEGWLDLGDPGAEGAVDLRVSGQNAMLVRSPDLLLRSDVDLRVKGPESGLEIKGEVKVTEAVYSKTVSAFSRETASVKGTRPLFSFRDGPLSTARFDVRVVAEDAIELRTNVARGRISADLAITGTGKVPRPEGQIPFANLKLRLPFTRATVERGVIRFVKGDPFQPRVDAQASARLRGYDLSITARGAVPDVDVKVASRPVLNQEDALFLLTTGSTPAGLGREGMGGAALARMGSVLSAGVLGGDGDGDSVAERLDVEIGREISQTGRHTIETEYRLTDRWYLRAEQDRFDEYNGGIVWRLRFR